MNAFSIFRHATFSVAAIAAAATTLFQASYAAEPINIGMVYAKQGPSATHGEFLAQGSELAVAQMGGQVLGRPVKLLWLDEPNPQVGQQNMQKLIDEDKVVAVMGGNISSTAMAMAAVAKRAKVPFIATNAAAAELTGKSCNRYTFRLQATALVQTRALMPYVANYGKRWYFLTPSYAFGQDILRSSRAMIKPLGATEVGGDEVPFNTADYSSYILKIREAKPNAVVGGLVGMDLSNFLKQWNELGMKDKIPYAAIAVSDTDFWDIGPDASTGTFVKPWYYNDPGNSPDDKAFTAAFQQKYHRAPSDKAWQGWFATRSLLQSIAAAKSTDPKAIVTALENWHETDNGLNVYYRKWDHQLIRPAVIVRIKKKITDKYDYFDVLKKTSTTESELNAAFGTPAEVGCQMDSL